MTSILFVCLGNICRSPCAEGLLKRYAADRSINLHVESCGLGDWHQGKLPDERMRKVSQARGVVLSSRAQAFQQNYFDLFDWILVADQSVMDELHKRAKTPEHKAKIQLMTKYSKEYGGQEVPDPFYNKMDQFEHVMDILEDACFGLLEHFGKNPDKHYG